MLANNGITKPTVEKLVSRVWEKDPPIMERLKTGKLRLNCKILVANMVQHR